jgi:hypothetical protein
VPAELLPEPAADPDPLAHRDPPRQFHVPMAPLRMCEKCLSGLGKEHGNPVAGDFFCCWGAGPLLHQYLLILFAYVSAFLSKKGRG